MRLIRNLWRNPLLLLLHLSFLLIAAGGVTTWLTAQESRLTLAPGFEVERYGVRAELLEFETVYYPGGVIPRDYVSHLLINGEEMAVSVNKPLEVAGCRIYQQAYTPDGCSIVTIRRDAAGTALAFSGFALFALSGLLLLIKGSRRQSLMALMMTVAIGASAADLPTVTASTADSIARQQVVYQGRVTTMSTVAHDVMQKIYGETDFAGMSAEQTVFSLIKFPDEWGAAEIIKQGDRYIAFNDCFDADGNYILPADAAVDERVGIFMLLKQGALYAEPSAGDEPLSAARVKGEILYNRVPFTLIAFVLFFIAAGISFLSPRLGRIMGWAAFSFQLLAILFAWWLSGRGPFASMFDTLQFLAVSIALMALLLRGMSAVGLLVAGCLALVAHLQALNPIVTPLMPVLHSPWLSLHVSLVMIAYALFIIIAVMALTRTRELSLCRRLLKIAVYLLGMGICTGAVWANESWGRYWGWDPKETWALITFVLYCVPLHLRSPGRWWYIIPLLSVAMTYFGVNHLPSLHSY